MPNALRQETERIEPGILAAFARNAGILSALLTTLDCNAILGNEPRELHQSYGACTEAGALRCAGDAQKLKLVCDGSEWIDNGTCGADENCDRESGTCSEILPGCDARAPGARFCEGREVKACGPDLVTARGVEECSNLCHLGECARVQQLAAGAGHTCVLFTTGKVRCWGRGPGSLLPVPLCHDAPLAEGDLAIDGRVVEIAAGGAHVCALLDTGRVRCWGCGTVGQLGYGNAEHVRVESAPDVEVGGDVRGIAAGAFHTCALLDGGSVRCWGLGTFGQLGYGDPHTIGDNELPFTAGEVNTGGRVEQLSAGVGHTCALLSDGHVRCWGLGEEGQLGYGSTEHIGDDEIPSAIGPVQIGGRVTEIAAGGSHTCALLDGGSVLCWGDSNHGKLGYQNGEQIGDRPGDVPEAAGDIKVLGEDEPVEHVTGGGHHTCVLLESGHVRCWGDRREGQLGYGDLLSGGDPSLGDEPGDVPGNVDIGEGETVVELVSGFAHSCVSLERGAVRCWGQGVSGALGYPDEQNIGDDETPSAAGDVPLVDSE